MSELVLRKLPVDKSSGVKQVIVQVPFHQTECYELHQYLGLKAAHDIEWITPIQVSSQYTGVPQPGYTFIIHPDRRYENTQWVDIFCNLEKMGVISFGGPHRRIVTGNCVDSERLTDVTVAFLVQIKESNEDQHNTRLLKPGHCIGTV